jgi:hypothetical protein
MSLERLRAGINRALKTMRAGEIPGQPLASEEGFWVIVTGPDGETIDETEDEPKPG